jgi:hypothetical protein
MSRIGVVGELCQRVLEHRHRVMRKVADVAEPAPRPSVPAAASVDAPVSRPRRENDILSTADIFFPLHLYALVLPASDARAFSAARSSLVNRMGRWPSAQCRLPL